MIDSEAIIELLEFLMTLTTTKFGRQEAQDVTKGGKDRDLGCVRYGGKHFLVSPC